MRLTSKFISRQPFAVKGDSQPIHKSVRLLRTTSPKRANSQSDVTYRKKLEAQKGRFQLCFKDFKSHGTRHCVTLKIWSCIIRKIVVAFVAQTNRLRTNKAIESSPVERIEPDGLNLAYFDFLCDIVRFLLILPRFFSILLKSCKILATLENFD